MSRKKDSDRPKKPAADDIHTTPPEGLKEALEDSEELAEAGKRTLEEAVASRSVVPPEVEVNPDDEDEGGDATVDIDESEDDLAEATGVFAASVDTITSALLVILGKFDETLQRNGRLIRLATLNSVLMVAVAGAMSWAVWRIEKIAEHQSAERQAASEVFRLQRETTQELKKLVEAQKKTDEKVDEVKKEQEKQPVITVEPDERGGAKVVITPKDCNGDAKDCERPKTPKRPKSGGSKNPPAPPPTAKIEIPIPGSKTSAPPSTAPQHAQQAPPPSTAPPQ